MLTLPGRKANEPWSMRVVPNLFPIVSRQQVSPRGAGRSSPPARGSHEVVIETPRHDLELPDRDKDDVAAVLGVLQQRLAALLAGSATRYVTVFKNRGPGAGTSLAHPHAQIVALDFLPEAVRRQVRIAGRHFARDGTCLLCSMLQEERRAGFRMVMQSSKVVAFTPYASLHAGEVLIMPTLHMASFTLASETVLQDLALVLQAVLRAARAAHDDPDYNLVLQTAPPGGGRDEALHWYWRFIPRLTLVAGFELGAGIFVNTLDPNEVASGLRRSLQA